MPDQKWEWKWYFGGITSIFFLYHVSGCWTNWPNSGQVPDLSSEWNLFHLGMTTKSFHATVLRGFEGSLVWTVESDLCCREGWLTYILLSKVVLYTGLYVMMSVCYSQQRDKMVHLSLVKLPSLVHLITLNSQHVLSSNMHFIIADSYREYHRDNGFANFHPCICLWFSLFNWFSHLSWLDFATLAVIRVLNEGTIFVCSK